MRARGPLIGGALLAAFAVGLGLAALARAQTSPPPPEHAGHDRTKWDEAKKAKELTEHAEKSQATLRKLVADKACPKTREEWDQALETLACYHALYDIWLSEIKRSRGEFRDLWEKGFAGTPVGARAYAAFPAKELREDRLIDDARYQLERCDKTNAPPLPDTGVPGTSGIKGYEHSLFLRQKRIKKEMFGLSRLSLWVCPDCPPTAAPGTTPRTPTPGGTGGAPGSGTAPGGGTGTTPR